MPPGSIWQRQTTHHISPIPQSRLSTRRRGNDDGTAMEVNMHRTFNLLAPTAIIGLSLAVGQAAEAPLPPRVNFVATPASCIWE